MVCAAWSLALFAVVGSSAQCTGSSSSLDADECAAWIALYDATGGATWRTCARNRVTPCACLDGVSCTPDGMRGIHYL